MLETHRDARHIDMDERIWISNQWNKWDMPYSWERPRAPSLPWSGRDINGAGVDVAGDKRRSDRGQGGPALFRGPSSPARHGLSLSWLTRR